MGLKDIMPSLLESSHVLHVARRRNQLSVEHAELLEMDLWVFSTLLAHAGHSPTPHPLCVSNLLINTNETMCWEEGENDCEEGPLWLTASAYVWRSFTYN